MDSIKETDLRKWSMLALLEKEFLEKVRLTCIFGGLGSESLLVTDDDLVYGIGSNASGCLGIGDAQSTLFPKKVEVLCGKSIVGFSYGSGPHVLAHTQSGDLYSWGHNGYGQLGNGTTQQLSTPALVQGVLSDKKVIQAACGSYHSVVLTNDGEVFAWGQNNCGQTGIGMTGNYTSPRKISFDGKKAEAIACGQTSTMAVLENGEVFAWGYNGNGQLGLGNNSNQAIPTKVIALQGLIITKIVCGFAHTLAVTDLGHLYTWGANSYGQLGSGNKSNTSSPIRVKIDHGRVVDVAASNYSNISAAVSQISSKVFMWGQCNGQCVVTPTETSFTNLHDIFSHFATPNVTYKTVISDESRGPSVLDSLKLAFDDPDTTDLKFVRKENEVRVHKSILKIRCEYFRSMFQDHWEENGESELEVPQQYSFEVYRAFLRYLYTDDVELSPELAIELLDLANSYCEVQLKKRCERLIRHVITIENVAKLYATAIKFEAEDLENFCFRFSLNHMTAVTQTDEFSKLDEVTLKDFIKKAAQNGAFKS